MLIAFVQGLNYKKSRHKKTLHLLGRRVKTATNAGWGTRIRTWADGVRVRCPTTKRPPKSVINYQLSHQLSIISYHICLMTCCDIQLKNSHINKRGRYCNQIEKYKQVFCKN
jgi:hypothetical protein